LVVTPGTVVHMECLWVRKLGSPEWEINNYSGRTYPQVRMNFFVVKVQSNSYLFAKISCSQRILVEWVTMVLNECNVQSNSVITNRSGPAEFVLYNRGSLKPGFVITGLIYVVNWSAFRLKYLWSYLNLHMLFVQWEN